MALSSAQVRAMDREGNHDPALTPDDGGLPVLLGTLLANLGDAAVVSVTADADGTYGQPEADLINELKANLNALVLAVQALARE